MNDETRKALDEIFGPKSSTITPIGASRFYDKNELNSASYVGKFEVYGYILNHLRQLYDDAITADDAAKLDAQREADINAENDKQAAKDKQDKSGDE